MFVFVNFICAKTLSLHYIKQANTSAIMLANTTSIQEFWKVLNTKYDLMNRKRSFWHHYIQEGMPEEDFSDFREDLAALGLLGINCKTLRHADGRIPFINFTYLKQFVKLLNPHLSLLCAVWVAGATTS